MGKFIPIDPKRCQAEWLEGSFMTLGPREMVRCGNRPIYIAKEQSIPPGKRKRGSMSLCRECSKIMQKQLGKNYAKLSPIEQSND